MVILPRDFKNYSDRRKVLYLLENKFQFNDISGAKFYNIFFAHQRISELRNDGYIIKSVKNSDNKLMYWALISKPEPTLDLK